MARAKYEFDSYQKVCLKTAINKFSERIETLPEKPATFAECAKIMDTYEKVISKWINLCNENNRPIYVLEIPRGQYTFTGPDNIQWVIEDNESAIHSEYPGIILTPESLDEATNILICSDKWDTKVWGLLNQTLLYDLFLPDLEDD